MFSGKLSWKGLAEVLGILGVVGSLVFVALEIRQNTAAVRSSTIQAISDQSYDATVFLAESSELRESMRASCTRNATADQMLILSAYINAVLRIHLNRYFQAELGALDERTAIAMGGRGGVYAMPVFAELWEASKYQYVPEFQAYVEKELLPLSREDCAGLLLMGDA